MMPVEYMAGNISGRQDIKYSADGAKGWDVETGTRESALGYQPRVIAMRRFRQMANFFQVRTRSTVNMSAANRMSMAVMGGAGALFGSLVQHNTATIYGQCVDAWRAHGRNYTFRGYIYPKLSAGLRAKSATISIETGIDIINPWVSSDTPNVPVSADILAKFNAQLS